MSAHHYLRSRAYAELVADELDETTDEDYWDCCECGERFCLDDEEPALEIPAGPVCQECKHTVCGDDDEEEEASDEAVD